LLDNQKEPWQRELFVPVCSGFTFFKIEVPKDNTSVDRWTGEQLPPAIKITLSFAEPYKTVSGTLDVPEEDKITRVIAVDRTRMLQFIIPSLDVNQLSDANNYDANNYDANNLDNLNTPSDNPADVTAPTAPAARPRGRQLRE
jgi:hypothetical protein